MKVDLKKVFIEALKPENYAGKKLHDSYGAKVGIFEVILKNGNSIYLTGYDHVCMLRYRNITQEYHPAVWLELVNLFDQAGVEKKPIDETEQELIELFGNKIISNEN